MLTAVQILRISGSPTKWYRGQTHREIHALSCCLSCWGLPHFRPILCVRDFVVAGRWMCLCLCIYISHFKHRAELHTWFRTALYFLGPSMHLSLSSGGPPSLPLAFWVKRTSGGGIFLLLIKFCIMYSRLNSKTQMQVNILHVCWFFCIITSIPQKLQNDLCRHPIFRLSCAQT